MNKRILFIIACSFTCFHTSHSMARPHRHTRPHTRSKVHVVYSHGYGISDWFWKQLAGTWYKNMFPKHDINIVKYADVEGGDKRTYFGQSGDLKVLYEKIEHVIQNKIKNKNDKLILVGISRGASAIINFFGSKKYQKLFKKLNRKIDATVLVAPFASMSDTIKQILKSSFPLIIAKGTTAKLIHLFARVVFPRYNPLGIQPLKAVHSIPRNLPVLMVTSKKDELCSESGVKKLHKELLKSSGKQKRWLLTLSDGEHNDYFSDTIRAGYTMNINGKVVETKPRPFGATRSIVKKGIQDFYKKNGIAY